MCEYAEVYQVDRVKARKEHRCWGCRGTIKRGEIYCYHHGVFDGAGFSAPVCEDCHALISEMNAGRDMDDTIALEEIGEAVFESDAKTMKRFIEIKEKHGAKVPDWMRERLKEKLEEKLDANFTN